MTFSQREWFIGRHKLRLEQPDVLWVDYQGRISREEAALMVELCGELGASQPFFMMGDLKNAGILEREVREYLSEHMRPEWMLASIYVGARLLHKAVARGVVLAAYLMGRADKNAVESVHFVSTRAEGYELAERLRGRLGDRVA